jgi:thiamine biosynthesis lipoprotein
MFAAEAVGQSPTVANLQSAHSPRESQQLQRFEKIHPAMGVKFKIVFYAKSGHDAKLTFDLCTDRITKLDRIFSDYKSESEIRKLCRTGPHEDWVHVSPQLWELMIASRYFHKKTNGAFDVTIGPVSKLWRQSRKKKKLPREADLAAALKSVGMSRVQIGKNQTIKLKAADMRIDFGGIAKGFAADQLMSILRARGIRSAMIDASGDILVSQPPPGKVGWKVEVAGTNPKNKRPRHLLLKNQSVATSGDMFQFIEIDNVRYSHIVNPKSGIGIRRSQSVTIVAADGMTADALASALNVTFGEDGLDLLKEFDGVEALVVTMGQKGKTKIEKTKNFPKLIEDAGAMVGD